MDKLKFLGICGSLRRDSRNMGLLRACVAHMPQNADLEIVDIAMLPFYNQDMAKPGSVDALVRKAEEADGFVFGCPEYNYSLAPALKNAIDWLSRETESPLNGKAGCVLGAGGGMGTCRSQNHLRQVCVYLNIHLLQKPEFFANAFSPAFAANGDLVDESLTKRIADMMEALAGWTLLLKNSVFKY